VPVELDVDDAASIAAAAERVDREYGRLESW
jgi:NAD(P)-dependent dehydrogenase (short-subunit alcohol dehydrogenase family)